MNESDMKLFQEFLEFKKYKEELEKQETEVKEVKLKKSFPKKGKTSANTRNPKGNGSVYRISNNRKKPWGFRITVGVDEITGQQKRSLIGTYETREQAEMARARYLLEKQGVSSNNEETLEIENILTVKQIYDILWEEKFKYKSLNTQKSYNSQFPKLKNLWDMGITKITLSVLENEFSKICSQISKNSVNICKTLMIQICDYALLHDLVSKNVAKNLDINKFYYEGDVVVFERQRKIFTKEEIERIDSLGTNASKMIMILLYTGMRPIELATMRKEDVNLVDGYMQGGAKTENGKDRIIPIHDCIKPYIAFFMESKGELLLFDKNYKVPKCKLESEWKKVKKELNLNHELYDTRHTFSTIAKISGVSDYGRKKIMGHASNDLTDDVYTHAPVSYLLNEINKIPNPKQLDI